MEHKHYFTTAATRHGHYFGNTSTCVDRYSVSKNWAFAFWTTVGVMRSSSDTTIKLPLQVAAQHITRVMDIQRSTNPSSRWQDGQSTRTSVAWPWQQVLACAHCTRSQSRECPRRYARSVTPNAWTGQGVAPCCQIAQCPTATRAGTLELALHTSHNTRHMARGPSYPMNCMG